VHSESGGEDNGDLSFDSARRIAARLISSAIEDWRNGRDRWPFTPRGRLARAAEAWLFDDGCSAPISFADCCLILTRDPARTRARIAARLGKAASCSFDVISSQVRSEPPSS